MRLHAVYALAATVFFAGLTSTATAQDNTVGAEAFRTSCAVCHGLGGAGDGEFAAVLTVKPPNLTLLSANNNGVFPYLDVFHTVDGRASLRAHGTSAMPIWGDYFERMAGEVAGPFGTELLVRAQIVALVDYVQTLQK